MPTPDDLDLETTLTLAQSPEERRAVVLALHAKAQRLDHEARELAETAAELRVLARRVEKLGGGSRGEGRGR